MTENGPNLDPKLCNYPKEPKIKPIEAF